MYRLFLKICHPLSESESSPEKVGEDEMCLHVAFPVTVFLKCQPNLSLWEQPSWPCWMCPGTPFSRRGSVSATDRGAQHLLRDLVWQSSGLKNWLKRRRKKRNPVRFSIILKYVSEWFYMNILQDMPIGTEACCDTRWLPRRRNRDKHCPLWACEVFNKRWCYKYLKEFIHCG